MHNAYCLVRKFMFFVVSQKKDCLGEINLTKVSNQYLVLAHYVLYELKLTFTLVISKLFTLSNCSKSLSF